MPGILQAKGNFDGKTDRLLRYRPDGKDFVIENGREFFNRPLYGGNTAFRVDAGDKPEFSIYLPGRGGNLRFGIKTANGAKWLFDADKIMTRYRPGAMIYEIRDALLGDGILKLTVLAMYQTEGLLVRAELQNAANVELMWAYGGANGERGRRDGDIGTERVPISEFFQLKQEFCKDNRFSIETNNFTLESNTAKIVGLMPPDVKLFIADARNWNNINELFAFANQPTETPVIVGRKNLRPNQTDYFALQRIASTNKISADKNNETQQNLDNKNLLPAYKAADLPKIYDEAEKQRESIADRVSADTPDAFINAATAALNVAGDAVWDEQQGAFMHGAVAWRVKLLGWRGPYLGDALGWHERIRRHLNYWATRQNVAPILSEPVKLDASVNFARNEPELHTNGDISNSHYDMNLVYIDALFRHILWTGDVEFAKKMFPVIKRHLAWEQRLFRREFGAEKLPLYEAYAAIWASDDLQYGGGGVAHATAYNDYHNKMAAHIAKLIGENATPFEREADLISRSMRKNLWLKNQGWLGEYKDLTGLQRVHESAAVWTFYHAADSETLSPFEAWQMSRYVETQIPHIPVRGENVPNSGFYTLSTTDWMPYTWSTNNVVMAEAMHTALGFWQSGRKNEAFKLFKGAILDSMFLGICPGNAGMTTQFDMARGESQRDFADAVGISSRALIEGLFGVSPDALAGELFVHPNLPTVWNYANLKHPDFNFSFMRENLKETYIIAPHFPKPMNLRLQIPALRDRIAKVLVNGEMVKWRADENAVGEPRIEINAANSSRYEVLIEWKGDVISNAAAPKIIAENTNFAEQFGNAELLEISDPQNALREIKQTSNSLTAKATENIGQRTIFAKVKQGDVIWQQPLMFEIRPAFEILPIENQDVNYLRFKVRNNTPQAFDKSVKTIIGVRTENLILKIPAFGESGEIDVNSGGLAAGSNQISIDLGNNQTAKNNIINWKIKANVTAKFETINLTSVFNDKVTNIFQHDYLSPRSPFVSLAIPKQGIGSWVHFDEKFTVDDAGLRQTADKNGGKLILPDDVPLATAGANGEKNIAFTSQWNNFPREISVPLNGLASHIYLLMAGSTNQMQSRFENGEIIVKYADDSTEKLSLENPRNWWAVDQDYFIDDFAFKRPEAIPPRVDLVTGNVRVLDLANFKGKGKKVSGGAATVLDLPLDAGKNLKSLTVRALANEVVIGLMSVTLVRN
ncbi:MAG: DUF4450 domain-containing protein [Acidobacteriota bacterium]|nr:DUF4450 domain-containing protein [Acidobacteriota bacterium]